MRVIDSQPLSLSEAKHMLKNAGMAGTVATDRHH